MNLKHLLIHGCPKLGFNSWVSQIRFPTNPPGADLQSTSCTSPLRGQPRYARLFKSVPYRFVDVRRTRVECVPGKTHIKLGFYQSSLTLLNSLLIFCQIKGRICASPFAVFVTKLSKNTTVLNRGVGNDQVR